MARFYLIPDLERLRPRDLHLLAFYCDTLTVSDGLMFWNFFNYDLPLLSYKNADQQASAFRDLAHQKASAADILCCYADLIQAGIIHHDWLARDTWTLHIDKTDPSPLRDAVNEFTARLCQSRVEIAGHLHYFTKSEPYLSSADAILKARWLVAERIVSELCNSNPCYVLYRNELIARFDSHMQNYMSSERFSANLLSQRRRASKYAGDLADVMNDIKANRDLIPIFASPDFSDILKQAFRVSPDDADTRQHLLELVIGILFLSRLPYVLFSNVDDVVNARERYASHLRDFQQTTKEIAATISNEGDVSDIMPRIQEKISHELIPAATALSKTVVQIKSRRYNGHIGTAVSGTGQVILGACYGEPTLCITGIMQTVLAGASWLKGKRDNRRELDSVKRSPAYKGLSLTLEMQPREEKDV